MNCKELEPLVSDMARSRVMDASVRQAVCAHTRDCDRCAARLAEAKQLTVGLRALAILDENQKASATVETNLLSAFRKQAETPRQIEALVSSSSLAAVPKWRIKRWAVAAAVVLLMLAMVALRMQTANKEAQPVEQNATQQEPTPQEPKVNKQEIRKPESPSVRQENSVLPVTNGGGTQVRPPQRKSSVKALQRLNQQLATNQANPNQAKPVEHAAQEEIATSFISLTQGYTLSMSEGGQVVRVELPRSALASFGLPVNGGRVNEPVKADVVVGNDGIARAIRFVR